MTAFHSDLRCYPKELEDFRKFCQHKNWQITEITFFNNSRFLDDGEGEFVGGEWANVKVFVSDLDWWKALKEFRQWRKN